MPVIIAKPIGCPEERSGGARSQMTVVEARELLRAAQTPNQSPLGSIRPNLTGEASFEVSAR